jgi:pyruvate,orthophosphate dikinase
MSRYVFDFSDGNKELKDLLGGKGANLAEMTRMGLPVPPGFTVTTDACREYLLTGSLPAGLLTEVEDHLRLVEARLGKRLGDRHDPLLLSVRSGARFSMPGMMETILDIGLNDHTVLGLAARSGDDRFAWDSYRRLIQMFGRTVYGVPGEMFETELASARTTAGVASDADLDSAALRDLVVAYQKVFAARTGRDFPQSPHEQLYAAITAVFRSWNADRAVLYRRQERIPQELGTAVNVMAMVFGNRGPRSGSGVAFTRDPATGRRGAYGDYLPCAQGEDVVAGIRNTMSLADLARIDPVSHVKLLSIMEKLEQRYRDLCVDAADPGRQAHPGRRVRDRGTAGRGGRHHPRRGGQPGHRRATRAPDVPRLRPGGRTGTAHHRHRRVTRCRVRRDRLRLGGGRRSDRAGRAGPA